MSAMGNEELTAGSIGMAVNLRLHEPTLVQTLIVDSTV
jgi:hypothetical protein